MASDKNTGSSLYSPWYTNVFVTEKTEQKQNALAKLETSGDVKSVKEWNDRAKRRFQVAFDRLSDETKRSYQSAARHFGKYLGLRRGESKVSGIVVRLIMLSYIEASTLVEEYVMWMQEDEDLAPNTINVRLAALRWFVDSARRVGWVEWKLDVKSVKSEKVKDTSGPSEIEFRRILRVIDRAEGKGATRNKLMVYMLAFMGLRISSVISLDMDNVDFDARKFRVKWKGKDRNYVWRPVGELCFEALEEWLEVRGRADGPVFTSVDRSTAKNLSRLSVRSARKIIRQIGSEAATKKMLHPHGFRHFHTTDNLEATDGNTRKVMKSTGHTSVRTIEEYDDERRDHARDITESMEQRWLTDIDEHEDEDEAEIEGRNEEYEEYEEEEDEDDDDDMDDVVSATDAAENAEVYERMSTGMEGVDYMLGGEGDNVGIVRGSIVLLGGYPGIGKSTLARQICKNVCVENPGEKVLVASGEETVAQVSEALVRLDSVHENLLVVSERSIDRICRIARRKRVAVLVIDSVSTVTVDEVKKRPGSVTQVKAIGQYILDWTKGIGDQDGTGIAVILISHVDKKGDIAGPKTLEHHVDAVYVFEGHKRQKRRILGCEGKNRFGDVTREVFFNMTDTGLVEIDTPDGYGDEDADQ